MNILISGSELNELESRIARRSATAAVIGLGYVGLPLAAAIARAGFPTVGFDIDPDKPRRLNEGQSYIEAVSDEALRGVIAAGRFRATDDFQQLSTCDVLILCVPTPLNRQREPDLSFVTTTAETVAKYLRRGQLIVLESTSYPGTTREVVKPLLERSGFRCGVDFLVGFSPERENPGDANFSTVTIPKVVAGDGPVAARAVNAFYASVVDRVVPVSSLDVAEAVKITENIFRAVNIALVNELKMVFDRMGIDIWEVIEAAKTKPFGFMPFYPGPGLGGHCIPIDPFYLTWKSREFEMPTRFIELAGEINLAMPRYVVGKLEEALDARFAKSLGSTHVLLLGIAYKKNVSDIRESPSLKIIELLERRGAKVDYHDPHVPVIANTREHPALARRQSVPLSQAGDYDAVLVATDHEQVDYAAIFAAARLIIDTRNVFARAGLTGEKIVKA